jgi:endoglucanase
MRGKGGLFAVLAALAVGAGPPAVPSPAPQEAPASTPTLDIKVDQAGYLPEAPKVALVVTKAAAADFSVRRADGSVAFQDKLAPPTEDADTGDRVQAADFTKLTESGTYSLDVPGVGRSWDFAIGPRVLARPFYLAMRSFYGQRCNIAVDLGREFPGYSHPACHHEGAYHASSGKSGPVKPSGGWHDAGDYGRYVVNSGISTGTLLWTWEIHGKSLEKVRLDIPESGNGVPDILNEVRWNLDWMLSMQDADGGVWQKQTSEKFCGFVMPEADTLVSYVIGTGHEPYKSTCATADLSAVMAIAARVYRPFDAAYAERCLEAARKAWDWVDAHPDVAFKNPAGISTGEYGDPDCGDERLWAAAELWRTTGGDAYHRFFLAHGAELRRTIRPDGPPGGSQVAPLALWTYVLAHGKDADTVAAIRQDSIAAADEIVARTARNAYHVSLTSAQYVWGSNGIAANYGLQLLVANLLKPDPRYVHAAFDDLHYLLGRNAFSLSWVTQVGAHPYRHPHHRPSGADNNPEPWPGLLSGGPNRVRQDRVLQALPDLPPAKMYVDEEASYASNEIAINWNAPLVFLLAAGLPER